MRSWLPWPVSAMTSTAAASGVVFRIILAKASPSIPGILTSVTVTVNDPAWDARR